MLSAFSDMWRISGPVLHMRRRSRGALTAVEQQAAAEVRSVVVIWTWAAGHEEDGTLGVSELD